MTPSPWIVLATTDNVTIGYKGPLDASCVDTAHGAPHRNQLAPIRVLETEWEVKHGATVTVVLVSPVYHENQIKFAKKESIPVIHPINLQWKN